MRGEKFEFRCEQVKDGCLFLTAPDCPNAIDMFGPGMPGPYGLKKGLFLEKAAAFLQQFADGQVIGAFFFAFAAFPAVRGLRLLGEVAL